LTDRISRATVRSRNLTDRIPRMTVCSHVVTGH
jgi:hypothetical protein